MNKTIESPEENLVNGGFSLTNYGIDFDVYGLVRRLKEGSIIVPTFQRGYVWTKTKASRFIESLLIGLPVPGVFLYREELSKKLSIIDGQQRLFSLQSYYQNKFGGKSFRLTGVQHPFAGKTYAELSEEDKRRLDDSIIHATIVQADSPNPRNHQSLFHIFERLNTGGMNLTPQEIRTCIYPGILVESLQLLGKDIIFNNLLGLKNHRKKSDEIALRMIALESNYQNYRGNMKEFLNDFLNDHKDDSSKIDQNTINSFNATSHYIESKIGVSWFRKDRQKLNLAAFDMLFVGIFSRLLHGPVSDDTTFAEIAGNLAKTEEFLVGTEIGKTHHTERVKKRIGKSIELFSKLT